LRTAERQLPPGEEKACAWFSVIVEYNTKPEEALLNRERAKTARKPTTLEEIRP
jgi:hypothetical protein